ncbi:S-adenosyl-L-methionine-dependent methyltransferase [Coemansia reversa NRRL 1564]|uniref:S-adenosyl-L-methionine-dependent methyltransferase n=1 Tax=Coemansia reversa (strain ATCC 12441 / NRRL 1564) TaxID=763665 RepID=A0A2G5B2Y4_COERN|nr:S-adenosyl-L-methionine-dependent methyltransferase [Coemansia reversa NRRL 1564]|eukprot:PIA13389.1 S-adenosyl-L-methionine-dependent methyltransferase [Coemansia reversa NRRL 1564]
MMAVSVEGIPPSSTKSISPNMAPKKIHPENNHNHEWKMYWAAAGTEHDQNGPSEALRELLEDHRWLLPRGRCLVAGCGRGYDALYLASRGLTCVAIDCCEPAIAQAQKLLDTNTETVSGKLTLVVQDIFTFKPTLRFTVAYEYGLFSAIHPSQRQQWAEAYARLIVPQGSLIVLLCPLTRRSQAPPYQVTMAECESVLKRYFVLVRVDSNCRCVEGQEGNELMSVWKRL